MAQKRYIVLRIRDSHPTRVGGYYIADTVLNKIAAGVWTKETPAQKQADLMNDDVYASE